MIYITFSMSACALTNAWSEKEKERYMCIPLSFLAHFLWSFTSRHYQEKCLHPGTFLAILTP